MADDRDLVWPIVAEDPAPTDYRIFKIASHRARHPVLGNERTFNVLTGADWVNVIALTPDDQVVLVRQFRHGTRAVTVEIPGGIVDPGESFIEAGARELREETGYAAETWIELGVVEPNPAIQDNRCGTVLALDAKPAGPKDLDPGEHIAVDTAPLSAISGIIQRGEIRHSLVIAAFFLLIERAGGWTRPTA